jgi:hypothetical protein
VGSVLTVTGESGVDGSESNRPASMLFFISLLLLLSDGALVPAFDDPGAGRAVSVEGPFFAWDRGTEEVALVAAGLVCAEFSGTVGAVGLFCCSTGPLLGGSKSRIVDPSSPTENPSKIASSSDPKV